VTEALLLTRLLRAFPGYTLATLREESSELLQLLTILDLAGEGVDPVA